MRTERGRERHDERERGRAGRLGLSEVATPLPDARLAMEKVAAKLARSSAEATRRPRQAWKERATRRRQREHALLTGTIAFCHEPSAGPTIDASTLKKYARDLDENVNASTRQVETRFLETPVGTLAQWLD